MNAAEKEKLLTEVVQRTVDRWCRDPKTTEEALFDTIYHERRRLEGEKKKSVAKRDRALYDRSYHQGLKASAGTQREIFRQIIQRFANEVVGHFDPRVYALSTRVIPVAMNLLLNSVSPLRLVETLQGANSLIDQLDLEGQTHTLKRLARQATIVLVPTHSSNLDSIMIGFGLYRLGLPPFTYGAGLNLFSNRLVGFFMHNLGAYKVDRRKQAAVYKDVLKTYAGCSMEMGFHNLFFPGGTRSRSGAVESSLKRGLLGMGLDAYVNNLRAKAKKPDVFIVPCTINYQLVLEAETLIADHLKAQGKSRFIIEDDEFSKPRRVFEFIQQLFSLHSRIHLMFGQALDVFGNQVDDQGVSHDHRGRPVDRTRYVLDSQGQPAVDAQRDREYTRELARSISESYHQNTVIKSTNLVSRAVFDLLKEHNPDLDLFRLLRTGGAEESFSLQEVYGRIERTLTTARSLAQQGQLKLDKTLADKDTVAVASEALAHLGSYHRKPALERRGDRLFHQDRKLLLYYQNRLSGFAWEG